MAIRELAKRISQKKNWVFTRQQLDSFKICLDRFRSKKTLLDGTVINTIDWDRAYIASGVKTSDFRVTWYEESGVKHFHIEKFDEMFRQWQIMNRGEEVGLTEIERTLSPREIKAEEVFKDY